MTIPASITSSAQNKSATRTGAREIKRLTTRLLDEQLKNRNYRKNLEQNRLLTDFREKNYLSNHHHPTHKQITGASTMTTPTLDFQKAVNNFNFNWVSDFDTLTDMLGFSRL